VSQAQNAVLNSRASVDRPGNHDLHQELYFSCILETRRILSEEVMVFAYGNHETRFARARVVLDVPKLRPMPSAAC